MAFSDKVEVRLGLCIHVIQLKFGLYNNIYLHNTTKIKVLLAKRGSLKELIFVYLEHNIVIHLCVQK